MGDACLNSDSQWIFFVVRRYNGETFVSDGINYCGVDMWKD